MYTEKPLTFGGQIEVSTAEGPAQDETLDQSDEQVAGICRSDISAQTAFVLGCSDQVFDPIVEVLHELREGHPQRPVFHVKLAREQDRGDRGHRLNELELRRHDGAKPIERIDRAVLDGTPPLLKFFPDARCDRFPQILFFRKVAEKSGLYQSYLSLPRIRFAQTSNAGRQGGERV